MSTMSTTLISVCYHYQLRLPTTNVLHFFPLKISKEGKAFSVPLAVATMSELIKSMKDEDDDEDDDDSKPTEVPLPNVKSEVLEKVIEFCQHHLVRGRGWEICVKPAYIYCKLLFWLMPSFWCFCHSIGRTHVRDRKATQVSKYG